MKISKLILSKRAEKYGDFKDQYGIYHLLASKIAIKPSVCNPNDAKEDEEYSVAQMLKSLLVLKAQRIIVCHPDMDHLYDFINYLKFAKQLKYFKLEFDPIIFSQGLNICDIESLDYLISAPTSIFSKRLIDLHAEFVAPKILPYLKKLVLNYQLKQGIPTLCYLEDFEQNLEGELIEFKEAFSSSKLDAGNTNAIDAICDSLVFICGFLISCEDPNSLENHPLTSKKLQELTEEFYSKLALPIQTSPLAENTTYRLACGLIAALEVYCLLNAKSAFIECIKEISSRQGFYSTEQGRFQKLNNSISYTQSYVANYESACKISEGARNEYI